MRLRPCRRRERSSRSPSAGRMTKAGRTGSLPKETTVCRATIRRNTRAKRTGGSQNGQAPRRARCASPKRGNNRRHRAPSIAQALNTRIAAIGCVPSQGGRSLGRSDCWEPQSCAQPPPESLVQTPLLRELRRTGSERAARMEGAIRRWQVRRSGSSRRNRPVR
jgi:hypothetical protein